MTLVTVRKSADTNNTIWIYKEAWMKENDKIENWSIETPLSDNQIYELSSFFKITINSNLKTCKIERL